MRRETRPKRPPVHPRALQGIAFVLLGLMVEVIGFIIYNSVDERGFNSPDPDVAYAVMSIGGFLLLAGVIIYAGSPSRWDWDPPEQFWRDQRGDDRQAS